MKNIIFLDFDGVITNLSTHFQSGDPRCIKVLNEIVEKTNAEVVISSTWRLFPDCNTKLYSWGFKGTVIGHTPYTKKDRPVLRCAARGQEIATWLSSNTDRCKFVIIDDEDDMGALLPHLVQTDTNRGLEEKHIEQVIEKFS